MKHQVREIMESEAVHWHTSMNRKYKFTRRAVDMLHTAAEEFYWRDSGQHTQLPRLEYRLEMKDGSSSRLNICAPPALLWRSEFSLARMNV